MTTHRFIKALAGAFMLAAIVSACNRPAPRTGDLVFVGIPLDYRIDSMSNAIGDATATDSLNIIHAAILDIAEDGPYIIDATLKHGVDRHPLDTFFCDFTLNNGSLPRFFVMRLKDNRQAADYVKNSLKYLGLSYNNSFVPCDTARYCTELIRDSYVRADGSYIFHEAPMNFRSQDGTMPPYWEELFAILGIPVPQGVPGTNPAAMMKEDCLQPVDVKLETYFSGRR